MSDELEVFIKLASKLHSPSACSVLANEMESHGKENSSETQEVIIIETSDFPQGSYALNELKVFGLKAKRIGDPLLSGYQAANSITDAISEILRESHAKALLQAKNFVYAGKELYRDPMTKIFITPDDIVATNGVVMLTHHNREPLPFSTSIRMTRLLEELLIHGDPLPVILYQPQGTTHSGDLIGTFGLTGIYKGHPYRYAATTKTPANYYDWKRVSTQIRQACGKPLPVDPTAFSEWKQAFSRYTGIFGKDSPKQSQDTPTMTILPPDGILTTPGGYEWGSIQWPFSFKGIFNPYLLNKVLSNPGITHIAMPDEHHALVADWANDNTSAYVMPCTTERGKEV